MAKRNQLLNQRLNQNNTNRQNGQSNTSNNQNAENKTQFDIRKKEDKDIVIKKQKKKKSKDVESVYLPVGVSPNTEGEQRDANNIQLSANNPSTNNSSPLKKNTNSLLSRMQPVQDKKEVVKETEEERVRRLYSEPTLTNGGILPKISEKDSKIYDEEVEKDSLEDSFKREKDKKLASIMKKIKISCVLFISFYLVFLIYGALMTNYEYNEEGKITPCVMTVKDIKQQKEFNIMLSYYEEARSIYERIYMIDYRLSLGKEDVLILAPEYEATLEQISSLSVSLSSANFSSKYSVIQSLLLDWVQNDAALYVQCMSKALSTNDATSANAAIQYRSSMYTKFVSITDNMIATGDNLNGIYTDKLKRWSLDNYIYEQVYGEEKK